MALIASTPVDLIFASSFEILNPSVFGRTFAFSSGAGPSAFEPLEAKEDFYFYDSVLFSESEFFLKSSILEASRVPAPPLFKSMML